MYAIDYRFKALQIQYRTLPSVTVESNVVLIKYSTA